MSLLSMPSSYKCINRHQDALRNHCICDQQQKFKLFGCSLIYLAVQMFEKMQVNLWHRFPKNIKFRLIASFLRKQCKNLHPFHVKQRYRFDLQASSVIQRFTDKPAGLFRGSTTADIRPTDVYTAGTSDVTSTAVLKNCFTTSARLVADEHEIVWRYQPNVFYPRCGQIQ